MKRNKNQPQTNATSNVNEKKVTDKKSFLKKFGLSKSANSTYDYLSYDYSNSAGHSKRTVRIVGEESAFAMREAYKTGRTNIVFALPEEECSVLLLTSSWPMEGKTTNCTNLAVAFAQTGAKTLLLDCDLRKPRIHKIFKINSKIGLTNVLRKFCTIDEAIAKTSYENLDVLTSGHIPPNPGELLGSEEMKELMSELKKTYRYIIIDTPPMNMVSDAIILSPYISGAALVVRQGMTDHKSITEALDKMKFAGVKMLGFILNDTMDPQGNYYNRSKRYSYRKNYYSSYYYGKAYKSSSSKEEKK